MEEPGKLQSMKSWRASMTERLHFHFSLSCIGEGNGNPLQCSCLEIPGMAEPGGLPSMESHRVGHDWSDLAASAAAQLDFRTQIFWLQNHYPPPSQSLTWMCYVYLNSYCDPDGEAAMAHYSHLTGWATGSKRWRQPATRDLLALHPLRLPPHLVPAV